MKSTRRHELQTNQLADKLGHWIEGARPYGTTILLIAGGAILVLFAAYFLASSKEKSLEAGWQQYLLAGVNSAGGGDVVEDLDNVTDQFSGTLAGQWAALTAADIQASRGVEKLFTDRAAAETNLNSAKTHYREVIESKWAAGEPLMMRRAQYGLAQVLEAQGELDEAAKFYGAVAEVDAASMLGKTAKARQELLAQTDMKKWYNWFGNQKPAPRDLGKDAAGSNPLGTGTDLNSLPESPSPDFMKDAQPDAAGDAASATPPAATTPPAGDPAAPVTPPVIPPVIPPATTPESGAAPAETPVVPPTTPAESASPAADAPAK